MTDAAQFAASLSKGWKNVKYDEKEGRGTANLGSIEVVFWEHSSDPAVCVEVKVKRRLKGTSETMLEAIEQLQQAIRNSD